jgi:hypothetical protein
MDARRHRLQTIEVQTVKQPNGASVWISIDKIFATAAQCLRQAIDQLLAHTLALHRRVDNEVADLVADDNASV